jgi:hypothetical protein
MSHTAIWKAVCETDPKHTKDFNRGGGFKGTAISPTYLAQRATEVFGPCGTGWGIDKLEEQYVEGAPQVDEKAGHFREIIHVVYARLWYVQDGQRGEVHQYGQTTFVGKNKYGAFTDEEAPKKSLTDAMSKCLSLLGFGADIHLGLYDDSKYVNDMRQKFSGHGKAPPKPTTPPETNWIAAATEKMRDQGAADKDDFVAMIRFLTKGSVTPKELKESQETAKMFCTTLDFFVKENPGKSIKELMGASAS